MDVSLSTFAFCVQVRYHQEVIHWEDISSMTKALSEHVEILFLQNYPSRYPDLPDSSVRDAAPSSGAQALLALRTRSTRVLGCCERNGGRFFRSLRPIGLKGHSRL